MPFRPLQDDDQDILSSIVKELLQNNSAQKFTYEELGSKIKEHFSDEYGIFDSREIGVRIIERNPEYKVYIRSSMDEIFENSPETGYKRIENKRSLDELAAQAGVKPIQNENPKEPINYSEILFFVVVFAIAIVGLFILYKIGRLIFKAYKKADHWLDK